VADVGPASTSREPTPPPSSPTLAAIVAERVADGDSVGVDDADTLLEPAGGNEPARLNVEATVEATSRRREKQAAKIKTTVKAKTGDSDTGDKRTKPKKDSDTSETEIELDERPVTKRRRSSKTGKPTKRTKPIEVADSDEDDVSKGATRYKSIKSSSLVKKWDGPTLHELRRDFQRRVLARDGFPPKCTHGNQEANYKLVLLTAKSCMDPTLFKSFKADLEAAHSSKDKE
jgi:hypothetical protein